MTFFKIIIKKKNKKILKIKYLYYTTKNKLEKTFF